MRYADVVPVLNTALMPGGSRRVRITFLPEIRPQCFNYLLQASNPVNFGQGPFIINLSSSDRTILVEANKSGKWPEAWSAYSVPREFLIPIVDFATLNTNKFVDEMSDIIEKIEIV